MTKQEAFKEINDTQEYYIDELIKLINSKESDSFKSIDFTSPTGTGKTRMMALLINKMTSYYFVITTLSKGQLHIQVKDNLNKLVSQDNFAVYGVCDYTANTKLTTQDIIDSLPEDKQIIWLRDEGHINTNKWSELFEAKIGERCFKIINFSATNKSNNGIKCNFASTMMLRTVVQQPGTPEQALEKLIAVKKQHKNIANYNPCAIFRCLDNDLLQHITTFCYEHNLKYINITDENFNMQELCKDDNEYDVIINKFKIVEGIDIRRAHVLYMNNEPKNTATTIQCIGRCRRNALLYRNDIDIFSHENEALLEATRQCYVYYNILNMKVDSDENGELQQAFCDHISCEQLKAGSKIKVINGQLANGLYIIELEGKTGEFVVEEDTTTGFNIVKPESDFYECKLIDSSAYQCDFSKLMYIGGFGRQQLLTYVDFLSKYPNNPNNGVTYTPCSLDNIISVDSIIQHDNEHIQRDWTGFNIQYGYAPIKMPIDRDSIKYVINIIKSIIEEKEAEFSFNLYDNSQYNKLLLMSKCNRLYGKGFVIFEHVFDNSHTYNSGVGLCSYKDNIKIVASIYCEFPTQDYMGYVYDESTGNYKDIFGKKIRQSTVNNRCMKIYEDKVHICIYASCDEDWPYEYRGILYDMKISDFKKDSLENIFTNCKDFIEIKAVREEAVRAFVNKHLVQYYESKLVYNDRELAIIGTDLMRLIKDKDTGVSMWAESKSVTDKVSRFSKFNTFITNKYNEELSFVKENKQLFNGKNSFNFDTKCNKVLGYCVEYYSKYIVYGKLFLKEFIEEAQKESNFNDINKYIIVRACMLKYKQMMIQTYGSGVARVIDTISTEQLIKDKYDDFVNTVIELGTKTAEFVKKELHTEKQLEFGDKLYSPIFRTAHIVGLADYISQDTIIDIKTTNNITEQYIKQVLAYHYLSTKRSDLRIKRVIVYDAVSGRHVEVKISDKNYTPFVCEND